MIPPDHPRYRSLVTREHLAESVKNGIVSMEGLTAHGRGEAFDYFLGERTTASALIAERTAAAFLMTARHPVISVNGNAAALAARGIADLQEASGAIVEVNLFHRTEERVRRIENLLRDAGADVFSGPAERLLPLSHDRAWCRREGMFSADVVLVPLEDGDRCEALVKMGKTVLAIDLNPLSRTARAATVTVVDELTRALPNITRACRDLTGEERGRLLQSLDNHYLLSEAIREMTGRLSRALD
ncbi:MULTISPECIES: 4-phosphopantoate--beta-alanine ligase [unclassified Methanoregula]|uniref:4-phosphopantoate--beta-alanine ligase n=1 Tax=unclassified Methanoregula TaxID=2649730 RepID=UPI0009CFDE21|nr:MULTISPECIES: 4-phosphopantoate--beta-alanine ligase [unclassified Methanoregula]OPX65182.1 MAG: Pantothenate synthetase [Methanoregula sp. PtaB.Bin085]OPY32091.1 MAG: Pantothenate synthetase [Methanoregula sp. PtaU1.Bin006]